MVCKWLAREGLSKTCFFFPALFDYQISALSKILILMYKLIIKAQFGKPKNGYFLGGKLLLVKRHLKIMEIDQKTIIKCD